MKNKKPLIVILLLIIVATAAWFGFNAYRSEKVKDVFDLIPSETSMVFELSDVRSFYRKVTGNQVQGLLGIPVLKEWVTRVHRVVPLLDSSLWVDALPKDVLVYCSVHASVSHEVGLVWYVPFEDGSWEGKMTRYLSDELKQGNYLFEQRKYEGHTLYEITDKRTKDTWTFTWHHNVLVGSYTGYLVEDVIRLIRTEYEGHFMSGLEEQRQSRKIHYDDGDVFVNYAKMPQFLSYFASDSTDELLNGIASFAETGIYDVALNEGKWLLHGYTYFKSGLGSYTSVFEGQKPQAFTLNEYIPMNTSVCYFWGIDRSKDWYRNWLEYNTVNNKKYLEQLKDWEAQHRLSIQHELVTLVGNEMTLLTFPVVSSSEPVEKVLLVKVKNKLLAEENLTEWRTRDKSLQKELYSEYYDGYKIHQWAVEGLPYWLCGDMAKGFDKVYYTFIQDVLVMGNSVSSLKNMIKSYNNQEVWKRNVDLVSRWKDLTASNFSIFIQPAQLKSNLQTGLNSFFATALKQNEQQYNLLKSIVIQFAMTQDKLYTNMVIEHNFKERIVMETQSFVALPDSAVIPENSRLLNVKVSDNWTDVFYLDTMYNLCLIDARGKTAWKFLVGSKLQTELCAGDFNKDGSSDYMFVASNKIHALSNKGSELQGFPVALSDTLSPVCLSVLDYDRTKNYRIAISDIYGNTFLLDLKGKILEGWSGKTFDARLREPLRHIRILSNDRLLAWNTKGVFYCLNRKGEIQTGFPLNTEQPTVSSYYLEKGTKLSDTYVYTVSDKGLKLKFNLEGKVEQKTELYRILTNGKFMLIPLENDARKFCVLNWDKYTVKVFDAEGNELFSISGNFSNDLQVKGLGNNGDFVFCFEDKTNEIYLVYDQKGVLLRSVSGVGNMLSLVSKKDSLGYSVCLLELKEGILRWFKLKKGIEETL